MAEAPKLLTLEQLEEIVEDYGLSFIVQDDGGMALRPTVKGASENVTLELLAVLRRRRKEIYEWVKAREKAKADADSRQI